MSQKANLRILPDGRIRIHWFQWDDEGPIQLHQSTTMTFLGPMRLGGNIVTGKNRGRIACMPEQKTIQPIMTNGIVKPLAHSDDPRAVTCDLCMATPLFATALQEIEG